MAASAIGALLVFAARGRERAGETTLRRAVGAPRRTLLAAALLEGGVLAVIALGVGGAVGWWLARGAMATWPGRLGEGGTFPVVAAGLAMIVVMLAGAALAVALAPSRRLTDGSARPAGLTLPSAQLGLALVLLTASSLLVRQATSGAAAAGRPARRRGVRRECDPCRPRGSGDTLCVPARVAEGGDALRQRHAWPARARSSGSAR